MTAKQYLRQLRQLTERIRIMQGDIETDFTKLTGTSAPITGDRVQNSPRGDRFADKMARLADKELKRDDLLWQYRDLRAKIILEIVDLDSPSYSRLLYEHYVNEKPLVKVAEEMGYAYSHTCRLHGYALIAFQKKYLQGKDDME